MCGNKGVLLNTHNLLRKNIKYSVPLQKCETASHKLTWSHYFELLKIEDDLESNHQ